MGKLLTISVAAYNVEKYLVNTLESFNDPRYREDIEVLIIDDGSKDGTKDIALKYQELAPETFHYVAKENGGHGSTINKSIELASGKYFRVVDGDDWVDRDNFAAYIEFLKTAKADLVTSAYHEYNEKTGKTMAIHYIKYLEQRKIYTWAEVGTVPGIWLPTLTIRTDLLQQNHVHILEHCYYVDLVYVIWCIYLAGSVQYLNLPVYIYRVNTGSQSVSKKSRLKNISMLETVAFKLAELYQKFSQKESLEESHKSTMFVPTLRAISSLTRTYLLMDSHQSKQRIIQFDHALATTANETYVQLQASTFYKVLRWKNYVLIPVLRALYRIYSLRRL